MPWPRPRRLLLALLALPFLFLFLFLYLGSRQSISDLFSTAPHPSKLPDEMAWYALGSVAKAAGGTRLRTLREEYPLVVFSKTYCPYSKRAKGLLGKYELSPAPKIIEVDLRLDASHVKTLLTRLTHQSTFPNIILHGRSLGGSDDLVRLHEEGRLRQMLETAEIHVGRAGEGREGVVL